MNLSSNIQISSAGHIWKKNYVKTTSNEITTWILTSESVTHQSCFEINKLWIISDNTKVKQKKWQLKQEVIPLAGSEVGVRVKMHPLLRSTSHYGKDH